MHMGTTTQPRLSRRLHPVHPHAHGDDVAAHTAGLAVAGSPPCTWGRRTIQHQAELLGGSPPCTWGRLTRCE